MSNGKSNTGIILAVVGVAAVLGLTLYLLTRKSKKIDEINNSALNPAIAQPVYGGAIAQPSVQMPVVTQNDALKQLNDQLNLTIKKNNDNKEGTDRGQA